MEETPSRQLSVPEKEGCAQCPVREENARLRARIAQLEARLEELERASHRQAAPFRIPEEKRKGSPNRPGRKRGHVGAYRARPEHVDEEIEVPLPRCPMCGESVSSVERVEQYIEDLPASVRPHVTRLVTYRGYCRRCDQEVCSRHRIQVSDATGSAGTHIGAQALSLSAELRHELGLPVRKTCRVLERCFGLHVTPGGLTQAMARVSRRLSGEYEKLGAVIRQSPAVYADETSWWVNGPGHWLWVFTTPSATLYRIEPGRGKDVVIETLGTQFKGRLVSDCLSSYDSIACKKHKCYAHHLRAVAEARRHLPESAYLQEVKMMLVSAMALGEVRHAMPDFEMRRGRLEQWAHRLLYPARGDPTEERVANRLRKQEAHLFGFLHEDGVEPTNNRAERQLRPAVIARKVSCGNRTIRGKRTSEVLMSLTVTARQQSKPFAEVAIPALSKAA
jgi:transposase